MTGEVPGPALREWWKNPWLWAFLLGVLTLTLLRPLLRFEPTPPPVVGQLPPFTLTAQDGLPFGSADLQGQVWVANFFFTRCTSICPRLTRSMARLQEAYERNEVDGIRLVSISVDPEHDTPERLAAYGADQGVHSSRWKLLTGDPARIRELVIEGFKTALGEPAALEGTEGLIEIAHSGKLVLVDGSGGIRGYFESDEDGLDEVFHRSRHVLRAGAN